MRTYLLCCLIVFITIESNSQIDSKKLNRYNPVVFKVKIAPDYPLLNDSVFCVVDISYIIRSNGEGLKYRPGYSFSTTDYYESSDTCETTMTHYRTYYYPNFLDDSIGFESLSDTIIKGKYNEFPPHCLIKFIFKMTLPSGVHMSDSAVLNTSPTAIEEPIEEGFKIFPNPTIDVIHVTAKQKGYLEVTDVNGSLLKKIRVNNPDILISLAGYPAGIYFILFHDKTGSYSRKCFKK